MSLFYFNGSIFALKPDPCAPLIIQSKLGLSPPIFRLSRSLGVREGNALARLPK